MSAPEPDCSAEAAPAADPHAAIDDREIERRVEALLFAASRPLAPEEIAERLLSGVDVALALEAIGARYAGGGVELDCVAGRYRLRTAEDLGFLFAPAPEAPRRLSRAAMETLAIIAYHQPVTRAEIEAIRGVGLSRGTLDLLLEIGWVRMRGRRRTPGRPITFGVADAFLEHFGLASLTDLPGVAEMKAMGLIGPDAALDGELSAPAGEEDPLDVGRKGGARLPPELP